MKIWVLNGPNLNMLGIREPEIYGTEDYAALCARVTEECRRREIDVKIKQTNHEGEYVDWIQEAYGRGVQGLILNPAAYTHTSIAIADALAAVKIPAVEVHLSDVAKRESFRQVSYVRPYCIGTVAGKGIDGYREAVALLTEYWTEHGITD